MEVRPSDDNYDDDDDVVSTAAVATVDPTAWQAVAPVEPTVDTQPLIDELAELPKIAPDIFKFSAIFGEQREDPRRVPRGSSSKGAVPVPRQVNHSLRLVWTGCSTTRAGY